jgi:chromosome partitioning protein
MLKLNKIINIYDITKSKTHIYNEERDGLIPQGKRNKQENGLYSPRNWTYNDLPILGERYGFLKSKLTKKKAICVYTPKGGVLKTTFSYNFARITALHNIKTLIIGLDVQGSITEMFSDLDLIDQNTTSYLSDELYKDKRGLYELSKNTDIDLKKIILNTDIPTLDYIPESSYLILLDQKIRDETKREFYFNILLERVKSIYDIIIFDTSPNWNFLIQNALTFSTDLISPISCEVNTFHSLSENIKIIERFQNRMDIKWDNFLFVPTKTQNTILNKEIETQYRNRLKDRVTISTLRNTVKGEKSNLHKFSVIEQEPKSMLANDYRTLCTEIWEKIVS